MNTVNTTGLTWGMAAGKLAVAALLFFTSGCSQHYDALTSSGMPQPVFKNGMSAPASEQFWSGVKPVSTLPVAHYKLGSHYQKSGKHALAIEEFIKAIKLDKGYVLAYNGLGVSYDALKDCQKAKQAYSNALLYGPAKAYLYNNLGYSRLLCNDPEHALGFFTRAAELDKTNARIHNNLVLAQLRVGHQIPANNQLSQENPPIQPGEQAVAAISNEQPVQVSQAEAAATQPEAPETPVRPDPGQQPTPDQALQSEVNRSDINADMPATAVTDTSTEDDADHADAAVEVSMTTAIPILSPGKSKKHMKQVRNLEQRDLPFCGIEVSNGNGVTGMAGKGAGYFRSLGFSVGRITNASHFNYESSKIYYQEGYLEIAKAIAELVPGPQELELVENLGRAGIGVKLLLGRDMAAMQFPENLAKNPGEQVKVSELLSLARADQ
jgi:tetratricopeptide (TPR) repeat protein